MQNNKINSKSQIWPELPYEEFKETGHLLHMLTQMLGKLKLLTPFEPEWTNVILYITSRGLSTGPIPYANAFFSINIDFVAHQVHISDSHGGYIGFRLESYSTAQLYQKLFQSLKSLGIEIEINIKPQEVMDPINFDQDTVLRIYNPRLALSWWQILSYIQHILQQYHCKFRGKTQPIGLMWGTFDIRDVRYNGKFLPPETTGPASGYLRRNALDEELIEVGWWSGNSLYPKAAFYSFTYPKPDGLEKEIIQPKEAHWEDALGEFILDYDDFRKKANPEQELMLFLESSYVAGAKRAGWNSSLIGPGKPF